MRRIAMMRYVTALALTACLTAGGVHAQFQAGPLTINGTVGFAANGYTASGISGRRAPLSAETFASARFNLYGLSTGMNLTYSTDQSRLRQSVNRLAFNTAWNWGEASLGDVAPSFSEYSLSGTSLRGGMVEIRPRGFLVAVTAGRARRAVEFSPAAGLREASFRRMMYGARIGYGDESETHLHLIGTYSRDHVGSISNVGEQSPHENLTLTPDVGLALLDGRLFLEGQITTSAMTKDTRTPVAEELSVPWYVFLTPHAGTRVSYAGSAGMRLDLNRFGLNAEYQRIQPGFESLGLARIRSDQELIRLAPTVRLLNDRVSVGVSFARTRNNLLDDLASTMHRRQWGGTVQARISQLVSVSGTYSRLVNENDVVRETADPIALHQRNVSQVVMLTPVLALQRSDGTSHTLSVSGSWQRFADESASVLEGLRPGARSDNLTSTVTYSLRLPSNLTLNATGNLLSSESRSAETNVYGMNAGAGYSFFERTLTLNVNGGWTRTDVTVLRGAEPIRTLSSQLTTNVSASYRLPNGDVIRFRTRGLMNASDESGRDFREVQTSLRFDHRF